MAACLARRGTSVSRRAAATLALLLACGPALAQEKPPRPELVEWAPRWKVGTWWVVTTWQRDTRERTRSPGKAEGATPALPEELDSEALPDLPPLRDGIPVGYKAGNRFRFEVVKKEALKYPDDEPGTPPEEFWVVRVETLEGQPVRKAELWYAVADCSLAKVVLDPAGKRRETVLKGTAQLDLPASHELGFPLDWPDLRAARAERAELEVPGRPRLEQRTRKVGEGSNETRQVRLAPVEKDPAGRQGGRLTLVWKPGEPFWSRSIAFELLGRLDDYGPR